MAEMESMNPIFLDVVKSNREKLNTKFAYARHAYPQIDGGVFLEQFKNLVEPLVETVSRIAADRVEEVVITFYDFLLDLIGKGLLGTETRYPALLKGWTQLFASLPNLLIQEPGLFAGSISNALYNLSINQGTRPTYWIDEMIRVGKSCQAIDQLLEVGKVVAWRSGMAHYRDGALETCMNLEPKLARAALCIAETSDIPIDFIVTKLKQDPWLAPWSASQNETREKQLKIASVVGAFRGYGGLFISPPEVLSSAGDFYVFDNENCWMMTADLFGATLHRLGANLPDEDKGVSSDFTIDKKGRVYKSKTHEAFPELASSTSFAANDSTLAVTLPHSYGIYLVAMKEV
jgi:hypothetical protein